uniref:Uncharacterized protein n=1 Tax=Setaria viridis TaxID=4556 RepID=A0A4U6UEV4_SETVI|nr:LOW QUALITY PROTEIN: hypothetical protein SEVIR_5G021700v2 [Setaria viridis]
MYLHLGASPIQLARRGIFGRDSLILQELRQSLRRVEHRRVDLIQLGLGVTGGVSSAHPGEVDAGIMGVEDPEGSPHAGVERIHSDLTGPAVHPEDASRQRARPLLLDHAEAVADDVDGIPQGAMLNALRLPQLGDFVCKNHPEDPPSQKPPQHHGDAETKRSLTVGPGLQLTLPVGSLRHSGLEPLHLCPKLADLRTELGRHLLRLVLSGRLGIPLLPGLLPLTPNALDGLLKGIKISPQPSELLGIKAGLLGSSGLEFLAVEAGLIDDGLEFGFRPLHLLLRRLLAPYAPRAPTPAGGNPIFPDCILGEPTKQYTIRGRTTLSNSPNTEDRAARVLARLPCTACHLRHSAASSRVKRCLGGSSRDVQRRTDPLHSLGTEVAKAEAGADPEAAGFTDGPGACASVAVGATADPLDGATASDAGGGTSIPAATSPSAATAEAGSSASAAGATSAGTSGAEVPASVTNASSAAAAEAGTPSSVIAAVPVAAAGTPVPAPVAAVPSASSASRVDQGSGRRSGVHALSHARWRRHSAGRRHEGRFRGGIRDLTGDPAACRGRDRGPLRRGGRHPQRLFGRQLQDETTGGSAAKQQINVSGNERKTSGERSALTPGGRPAPAPGRRRGRAPKTSGERSALTPEERSTPTPERRPAPTPKGRSALTPGERPALAPEERSALTPGGRPAPAPGRHPAPTHGGRSAPTPGAWPQSLAEPSPGQTIRPLHPSRPLAGSSSSDTTCPRRRRWNSSAAFFFFFATSLSLRRFCSSARRRFCSRRSASSGTGGCESTTRVSMPYKHKIAPRQSDGQETRKKKAGARIPYQVDEALVRAHRRVPGHRVVSVLVLQRLPNPLSDLGGGERTRCQDGTLGRHARSHVGERTNPEHQRHHPPGMIRPDDPGSDEAFPHQAFGAQGVEVGNPPGSHRRRRKELDKDGEIGRNAERRKTKRARMS